MLEDLRTTEQMLKDFLPSSYEDGGNLAPLKRLAGALSAVFSVNAASENLSSIAATVRLLNEFLPPDGIEGRLQDIHGSPDEFQLYNFFGRADEFWRNRSARETSNEVDQAQSIADDLYKFKQKPLNDAPLAQRILAAYVISGTKPLNEEERKESDRLIRQFTHMLGPIPPTPEYTEQHFTEQHSLCNFGKNSVILDRNKEKLPDNTFSTFLASRNYLPKTHLVAADMNTRTFRKDGAFFEGANFRASSMMSTQWDLSTTSIRGALFEGADLRGAKGLTVAALAATYIDERTRLPAGIKYAEVMRLHEQHDMPPPPAFTKEETRYMPKMA